MTSNQSVSDIADFYGLFTFQDPLIYWAVEAHDNWRDREFALRKDYYIKAYIKRLDEEIFTEKPITTPDIFGQESSSLEISDLSEETAQEEIEETEFSPETNIAKEWDNERYSQLFTKTMDKSRTHSYSVVRLYNTAPFWRVFCDREITEIKYNKKDVPIGCTVEWSKSLPKSDKFISFKEELTFFSRDQILNLKATNKKKAINYALFVPFGVPESEDQLGEFDLDDKWTLAVEMRYCNLDITNNSAKSSGFFWLKYGMAISPTQQQSLLNAIDMAGSSRGVGAKGNVLEDLKAMFPAKPEFTLDALNEKRMQYSMACRLPLSYFRSEKETSGIFNEQSGDEIKVNKKKKALFAKFKPYFKDIIFMRWGIELEEIEPFILETEEEEIEMPLDKEQKKPVNGSKMELIK